MPIRVNWNSRAKIFIDCHFQDPWTLDDFIEARKIWYRLIKSVDYRVPIVLDFCASQETPVGALRHFSAIHRTPHPRQGHIYIMGLSPSFEKLSAHLFNGVVNPDKSVRVVDSIDCLLSPS
jgi:hypothetical protein